MIARRIDLAEQPSWQAEGAALLSTLEPDRVPGLELIYLDALAAHLLGPDAPAPPYTMEQGTAVVQLLLRALAESQVLDPEDLPQQAETEGMRVGREALVGGAHRLAQHGGMGAHQLVIRLLAAVVGELERHKDDPEQQVLSLFHFGLLAIASGPENEIGATAADGLVECFAAWNEVIGAGFVPPWRQVVAT